jgi:hypothetical protein
LATHYSKWFQTGPVTIDMGSSSIGASASHCTPQLVFTCPTNSSLVVVVGAPGVLVTDSYWHVYAPTNIIVSAADSVGISHPSSEPINITSTTSGGTNTTGRVEVVCKVAGANAINYPAKLQCCVGCASPYNLTWLAD